MTVEIWKAEPRAPRTGPSTGPAATALEPRCVQTVTVEAPEAPLRSNERAYIVTSGDVRLEFRLLPSAARPQRTRHHDHYG